jgi:hypothetical protein
MTKPDQKQETPGRWVRGKAVKIVVDCAMESAVNAFLLLLMGKLALSMVGGLAGEFAPSPPPGFHSSLDLEISSTSFSSVRQHAYLICFDLLFATTTCFRLFSSVSPSPEAISVTRLKKIGERLSSDWFTLIVGNAFGAAIAAMVVGWVQQFSVTQMIYRDLFSWLRPYLRGSSAWVMGESFTRGVGDWLAWFNDNQVKFTFWLLYLAAVCDDLGIPNLKRLARWGWRRARKAAARSLPAGVNTTPKMPAEESPRKPESGEAVEPAKRKSHV